MGSRDPIFPRLVPPESIEAGTEELLAATKFVSGGRPLRIHQVLSHHPTAVRALNGWLDWGEDALLSQGERRLLILRVAALTRCSYEWSIHSSLAVANAELDASVVDGLGSAVVSGTTLKAREAVLVKIADAVCESDTISDAAWHEISDVLSPSEIIEALLVVGYYRLVAGLANALGVPDEDREKRENDDHLP